MYFRTLILACTDA